MTPRKLAVAPIAVARATAASRLGTKAIVPTMIPSRPVNAREKRPGHIELARWCEMFVVLPATANVIGQAANGLGSTLLTTTILASPQPVVFYPNVNDVMWSKAVVQRNVETLRGDGHIVIEPEVAVAYEVDSGETRESLVVPEPAQLIAQLLEIQGQSESLPVPGS